MEYSRRDLGLLFHALLTGRATAATKQTLPSECFPYDTLKVKTNAQTHQETRNVFDGLTHQGWRVDMHITKLAPGMMPHPPHAHVHEEMMMIKEGTLEVTILDKSTRIGPGSVVYVHSNEMHGLKNVGETPAEYFVLAIGQEMT